MSQETPTTPLRIGILGASRIAPVAVIRPARRLAGAEVVAVAARERTRAVKFAQRHAIPRVHDTYDDLISDPDIDALYNPLPNSLHAEWSIRALQAGKHVLCEKPIAANAVEARRMAEAADAAGRRLMEAFHWRYHEMARRIIAIVRSGGVGTVRHVAASMCIPMILPGNIRYRLDLAGGAMMDVGAYTVSMLRHVSGEEPEVVSATSALASPGVDRLTEARMTFPSGATGWMQASLLSRKLFSIWLRVDGDRGTLFARHPILPQLGLARLKLRNESGTLTERFGKPGTYDRQLEAFVSLVQNGTPVPTDAWDGVRNMAVIDQVYRAAGLMPRGNPPGS